MSDSSSSTPKTVYYHFIAHLYDFRKIWILGQLPVTKQYHQKPTNPTVARERGTVAGQDEKCTSAPLQHTGISERSTERLHANPRDKLFWLWERV